MQLTFRILESPELSERGQTITLDLPEHDSLTIGRESDARLQLMGGGYISRHHLVLEVSGPRCYIRDLGSRNKTYIRRRDTADIPASWELSPLGQAIPVFDGDYVRFGRRPTSRTVVQIQFRAPVLDSHTEKPLIYCVQCGAPVSEAATAGMRLYTCPDCRKQGTVRPDVTRLPTDITPHYQPLEEVGRGAMGVVYRARRVTPDHPQVPPGAIVALKTIIPEVTLSQNDRARFRRETDVCQALNHPHLVRFYDRCDFQEERLWFAMEYLDGGDAAQHAPFPLDEALLIADQILEALDYAHRAHIPSVILGNQITQRGAVHRDIKPSNILITGSGLSLRAKLADFGLAKGFQFAGQSHFTATGILGGSMPYMPPEQITDFRNVKPAADIYSFGATLYTLLTGEFPYASEGGDVFLQILEKPIIPLQEWQPFPAQHAPRRWDALAQVIEVAMRKRPQDRFPSAAHMRAALAAL